MVAKIHGQHLNCLLSIVVLVRMTECLIVIVKLRWASSQSILSLSFCRGFQLSPLGVVGFTHHWRPWCGCFWLLLTVLSWLMDKPIWRIAEDVLQLQKVIYRRFSATIGRFWLHQFCQRFSNVWSLCVFFFFWRDLGSCYLTSTHTGRIWVYVMLFWASSVLVRFYSIGVES